MFRRVFKLFQIARKLSTSGAVDTINEIYRLPTSLNFFFHIISIGSNSNQLIIEKVLVKNYVLPCKAWVLLLLNWDNFWLQDQIL